MSTKKNFKCNWKTNNNLQKISTKPNTSKKISLKTKQNLV